MDAMKMSPGDPVIDTHYVDESGQLSNPYSGSKPVSTFEG